MNTRYKPFIVKWGNGTYSIFIGTGNYPLVDVLDEIGDPTGNEARLIPGTFAGSLSFHQEDDNGKLSIEVSESAPSAFFNHESSDDKISVERYQLDALGTLAQKCFGRIQTIAAQL